MATPENVLAGKSRVAGGETSRLPIGLLLGIQQNSCTRNIREVGTSVQEILRLIILVEIFYLLPSQITRDDFCSEDRRQVNQKKTGHIKLPRPPSPGHTHRFVLVARALIRRIQLHAVYGSFERTDQRAAQFQLEAASTKKANGSCISLSLW